MQNQITKMFASGSLRKGHFTVQEIAELVEHGMAGYWDVKWMGCKFNITDLTIAEIACRVQPAMEALTKKGVFMGEMVVGRRHPEVAGYTYIKAEEDDVCLSPPAVGEKVTAFLPDGDLHGTVKSVAKGRVKVQGKMLLHNETTKRTSRTLPIDAFVNADEGLTGWVGDINKWIVR